MQRAGWRVMHHGGTCYHLEQRASAAVSPDAWRHLLAYARWIRKWGWLSAGRADRPDDASRGDGPGREPGGGRITVRGLLP